MTDTSIGAYDMACHNLLYYSDNYLCTKPKVGFEKEWQEARQLVHDIEVVLKP